MGFCRNTAGAARAGSLRKSWGCAGELGMPGVLRQSFLVPWLAPGCTWVCLPWDSPGSRGKTQSEGSAAARQSRGRDCVGTRTSWKGKVGNCFVVLVFFSFSVSFFMLQQNNTWFMSLGIFFVLLGPWHHCYIGWLLCWGWEKIQTQMYTCRRAAEWVRSSFCMSQQPKKWIIMCSALLQNITEHKSFSWLSGYSGEEILS